MNTQPIFLAERIGNQYRGEVIDANTFERIAVTAHNYHDKTVAECAARRMWAERVEVEV